MVTYRTSTPRFGRRPPPPDSYSFTQLQSLNVLLNEYVYAYVIMYHLKPVMLLTQEQSLYLQWLRFVPSWLTQNWILHFDPYDLEK